MSYRKEDHLRKERNMSDATKVRAVCVDCGAAFVPDIRWVDDDGLLCPDCAKTRRIHQMRDHEHDVGLKGPLHF